MKDYNTCINLEMVDNIVAYANNNDFEVYSKEGTLNDFFIIPSNKKIKIGNARGRNFIILFYKFRNSYSNDIYLKMTDSLETAIKYAKDFACDDFLEEYDD